ncbi:hypothetical protein [Streptomyces aureocirculatus]|uniref:hypothetical protein n=1 Tax=Streptomyces aureocirculatus TaxID=67275 RepID=UPI0004CAC133|nr:hypothetical protein [Streptomyces aureocirculatus]
MSRDLQHLLHTRLKLATEMLDLPLTNEHLEHLAVQLTPAIIAFLAERRDAAAETAPVPYTLADHAPDDGALMEVSLEGGCIARVGLDVDLDSPAAILAQRLHRQPDVVGTVLPDATTLELTVRPRTLDAWRWWLGKCGADQKHVQDDAVQACGQWSGATVHLRGEGVPALQQTRGVEMLQYVLGPTTPRAER